MKLRSSDLLKAFSIALDHIEKDFVDITLFHGTRVAYYSMLMGQYFTQDDQELYNLLGCAFLHDNGYSDYYQHTIYDPQMRMIHHCEIGEERVTQLPFFKDAKGIVLYHHERYDGKGPYGLKKDEIPIASQIIHLIGWIDVYYRLEDITEKEYNQLLIDLYDYEGTRFSKQLIDAFKETITYPIIKKAQKNLQESFYEDLPIFDIENDYSDLVSICELFASIIDSQSHSTKTHSLKVAHMAKTMAEYYNYDEEMVMVLFFVGILHDLGKIIIQKDLLEKPARLTNKEFTYMQTHAYYTYEILDSLNLGDIVHWAGYHHEKLDGSGYPFGKTADELDFNDRLVACCDIYQALREDRSYKDAYSHEKAMKIMRGMVDNGKIDGSIVEDIDKVYPL